jgi:biopolymer transport protein ExbD
MKLRKSRTSRRGRIEIIPMIDVMFFLLATFMLASLSMQNLHSLPVNLPRGQAAPMQTKTAVTLTVTADSHILLDKTPVTLATLTETLKPMLRAETKIILAADSAAPHGITVQAMLRSREAGAQQFLIAVKRDQ